jgi:hypothetical protein
VWETVKLGGKVIGSPNLPPDSGTFTAFSGGGGLRKLSTSDSKELALDFASGQNAGTYAITIEFDVGCSISASN